MSHLPDFTPETFSCFVQWLYKGAVGVDTPPGKKFDEISEGHVETLKFEDCIELYRLADFLGVQELEVDLIEYVTENCFMGIGIDQPRLLHWLYEDVPYKKPFRNIVCEDFAQRLCELERRDDSGLLPSPWLRHHEYPADFWPDLALALYRRSHEGRDSVHPF